MTIDREKTRVLGYLVVAVLIAILGVRLMDRGGGGQAAEVTIDPPSGSHAGGAAGGARGPTSGASAAPGAGARARPLLVQVAGEVRRPGVYTVAAGARGQDAVERAGGLTGKADQAGVNLVAPLRDGQQVIVPRRGAVPAGLGGAVGGGASGVVGAGGPVAPISLSSATPEQLDALDGIGPTLAGRIVQYRQAHGGFRSIDELSQVDGIGEKRMAALRKAVTP